MSRVRWSDSAIDDLRQIRTRLDAYRPDLTQAVIDNVVLSTDLLVQNPGIGPPVGYRRWRKWRAGRTAYLIIYQPDRGGLTIVRVLHDRSDWVSAVS